MSTDQKETKTVKYAGNWAKAEEAASVETGRRLFGCWSHQRAAVEPPSIRTSGDKSEKSLRLDHADPPKNTGFHCE